MSKLRQSWEVHSLAAIPCEGGAIESCNWNWDNIFWIGKSTEMAQNGEKSIILALYLCTFGEKT